MAPLPPHAEHLVPAFKASNPDEKILADHGQLLKYGEAGTVKKDVLIRWDEREDFVNGRGRFGKKGGGKSSKKNDEPEDEDTSDGGDEAPTREELEARCKELEIPVHHNMKDETLQAKIAEAEAK